MSKNLTTGLILFLLLFPALTEAQWNPWVSSTLLPDNQFAEIAGEASGETAWNTVMETGGYNKNRLSEEYRSTFYEAEYVYNQLQHYGITESEIIRYYGGTVWDGICGELWEVSPGRRKLASYQDMTAMLAKGSNNADLTAELLWIGRGSEKELEELYLENKIVVTEGSLYSVHNRTCLNDKAPPQTKRKRW